MCYEQYTISNVNRTWGIIWEIIQRDALVPFAVIDNQLQVIIINIHGIDERIDDVPAEERIVPISFCEPVEEKQNTVTVQQLGLGITESLN